MNTGESNSVSHAKSGDGSGRPILPSSLVVDQRGPVTLLRLSRPAKSNALDGATIAGIETFFANRPEKTRVIIVHAREGIFQPVPILLHSWMVTHFKGFLIPAPGTVLSTG